jgi:hypothetical protein
MGSGHRASDDATQRPSSWPVTVPLIATVVWVIALIVGSLAIHCRGLRQGASTPSARTDWLFTPKCPAAATGGDSVLAATEDFPRNHRLSAGDLATDSTLGVAADSALFVRRYLPCAVPRKGAVRRADLLPAPELRPPAERSSYLVSLDAEPGLARLLNAGSRIDIWEASKPLTEDAVVTAVLCRGPGDTRCAAAISVSSAERRVLLGRPSTELRLLVRQIKP